MTKKEFLGIINDIDDDFVKDYFTGSYQGDNITVQPIYTRQNTAHGWKRIFPAAAAICAVMAVIIGGIKLANINFNETVPANSGENPANVDTVINHEVERANKIAGTANDFLTVFLSDAIMGGYGYNGSDQTLSYIVLIVKDGVWSCQSQMYGYGSGDEISWCGEAKDITAETSYFKSAEEKLCAEFASVEIENFEGFENINGVFTFVISQGAPRTAFIEGSPEEIIIEMDLEMFNPKDYDGNFPEKYKWSGGEAGVAKDKKTGKTVVVGTFPVVEMDDEEIPRQEETAHTYAYKNAAALYETVNNFLTNYCPDNGIEINKLDELQTITMTISYGRYNAAADEDLVSQDDYGKFIIRIINNVEDEYDYSSGWFKAYIVNGECKGIVFMSHEVDKSISYPSYEDFQKGSYHWDSLDDIGYVNGIAMGVYPELPYEEASEITPPAHEPWSVPFEDKTPETELAENFTRDYLAFHQKHNEEAAIDLDKYFDEGNLKEYMGLMTELNIKKPKFWSRCYNKPQFIINELNTISHEEKNGVHEVYVYYSVSIYETDVYDPNDPEKKGDWGGYGRTAAFQIKDGKIVNFDMEDVVYDENGKGQIVLPENNPWNDAEEAESRIQSVKKWIG